VKELAFEVMNKKSPFFVIAHVIATVISLGKGEHKEIVKVNGLALFFLLIF